MTSSSPIVIHAIKTDGIAGAEAHLLDLLAGLRAAQHDARLLLLDTPARGGAAMAAAAEGRDIPVAREVIYGHLNPGLTLRLARRWRRERPDIVHTHLFHADTYGIPAARLAGVRAVVSSRHNNDARRARLPLRALNWALWQMADAGIGISDAVAGYAIAVEGVAPGKMHTIHYGLAAPSAPVNAASARAALRAELGLDADALLLGTVGRLIPVKAIDTAIAAFGRVAADFPRAHLVVAGDGPLRAELQAQANAPGLGGRVHFLGWRTDIPAVMAALDVFMLVSHSEGFGLTLLEAMHQGTPIIGSRAGAIPEVVLHERTGLIVPPGDANALAAAMRALLDDPDARARYGAFGRDRVKSYFSAERMVGETLALYARLLARRP